MISLGEGLFLLVYNLFVLPVLLAGAHLLAVVDGKFRRGVRGRYTCLRRLKAALAELSESRPRFLLHAASMGEFEHVRPFLRRLKQAVPDCWVAVTFFSPSGFENVRPDREVDFTMYLPFDWPWTMRRLFALLRPRALFISRYDVWPNQIWLAYRSGVPAFLLNASLTPTRFHRALLRPFLRPLYHRFATIFAASDVEAAAFADMVPGARLVVSGDTKFEQVWWRREQAQKQPILPAALHRQRPVLVCGSIWPEDAVHLLPALGRLWEEVPDLLVVLCPHEPEAEQVRRLLAAFPGREAVVFSRLDPASQPDVLVIDRVGILPLLYATARVAYVGGGFKQGVHNILEPAAYGIPVLFGPRHRNAPEAEWLKVAGAGFVVTGSADLHQSLRRLFNDPTFRDRAGRQAEQVVKAHLGATAKILCAVLDRLGRQHPAAAGAQRRSC
ncbi:MAG: hypothetical protein D6715_02430 [Calditrichaeota bacterium]|nr:MAG: hypothetical protein D6715_02430 [Calditrichota bacterium]